MQAEEAAVLGKMVPGAPEVPGAVAKGGIYLLMALTVLPIPAAVEVAVGCTPMGRMRARGVAAVQESYY